MKKTKTERITEFKRLESLNHDLIFTLVSSHPISILFSIQFLRLHFRYKKELRKVIRAYPILKSTKSKRPTLFIFYKYIVIVYVLIIMHIILIMIFITEDRDELFLFSSPIFLGLAYLYYRLVELTLRRYKEFVFELSDILKQIKRKG